MVSAEIMDERELVDLIADACAVSTKSGLLEVAGLAVSLDRRVRRLEGKEPHVRVAAKAMSFASNAEYRAWCASNDAKPRVRVRAGSAPYP